MSFSSFPVIAIKTPIYLFVFFVFFRSQTKDVNTFLKYASTLIVFGLLGNFLDKILIGGWNSNYLHTDNLLFRFISRSIVNLSSILSSLGSLLLIIAIALNLKDFISLFKRTEKIST